MGENSAARDDGRTLALSAWCVVAAFGTYFCMYAFRKPFTAASYEGLTLGGFGYKTVLVAAQVAGYTLSKFLGIKVIAEMTPGRRAAGILLLIGVAEAALLGFALVPPPYNLVCLFVNGLPLGMVFGLVLGFLEGRRVTEALTAGLCASFIVADGAVKSVGAYLLEYGVSEMRMPFVAGLIFIPPLLAFVWMLTRIPPPSAEDIAHRRERPPMTRDDRRRFFRNHAAGLTALVTVYLLITVLRSVRSDFAPEVFRALGLKNKPEVFAQTEALVALGVMAVNGTAVFIRDNRRALFASLCTSLAGLALVAAALAGLSGGRLGALEFMMLLGLGLYIPYVAVHTTIFERLIALLRDRGNLGYLMYLADAFGYLGAVAVLIAKDFVGRPSGPDDNFLEFFVPLSWAVALGSAVFLAVGWVYFARRTR